MSHLTVAVSEDTFRKLFAKIRNGIKDSTSSSGSFGPFTLSWNIGVRLEGGTVDLQANNSVVLHELDVVYDPVQLTFGIDLPEICVGGWCIVPNPFGGCLVRLPRICVFSGNPDIKIPVDLSGLVTSEISGAFRINTKYVIDPGRTAAMTDLDAEDAGVPNEWQFLLDPIWIDIDILDFADTVGNILDKAIDTAVDGVLGPLPGWVKDIIKGILGPIVDLVRAILDIGDDIDEWLSNLLGVSLGILDFALTLVADAFAKNNPIFAVEDPFPILPYQGSLIPVKIPLRDMAVVVNDDEMILSANVGG